MNLCSLTMSTAALTGLVLTASVNADTYSNGGVDPQPGGCNGSPYSAIEAPSNLFGNNTIVTAWHQADNFIVPQGQSWALSQLTWRLYQSNSTPNEPIQAFYVRIWSGNPMQGGAIVAGDMTTNRLIDSTFAGYYRVSQTDTSSCARAVKDVTVDMTWLDPLIEGEYWLEVGSEGNPNFSGPWANHVVPRDGNENSLNFDVTNSIWEVNDSNGVGWDYPFTFEYTTDSQYSLVPYPFIHLTGSCPGPVTVTIDHCTPFGNVAVLYSFQSGQTVIPNGKPCAGTVLGLRNPTIAGTARADENGTATLQGQLPANACDRVILQALDLETCDPSGIVLVPFDDVGEAKLCEYKVNCRLADTESECAGPVLDALKALESRVMYARPCDPGRACDTNKYYHEVKVRYKDANGVIRECRVEVEVEGRGRCVIPVASPFNVLDVVDTEVCGEWNP